MLYTPKNVYSNNCAECEYELKCHEACEQLCESNNDYSSMLLALVVYESITLDEYNEWAYSNGYSTLVETNEGYEESEEL